MSRAVDGCGTPSPGPSNALCLKLDMLAEGDEAAGGDVGLDERLHDEIAHRAGLAGAENPLDLDASLQFRIQPVLQVIKGFFHCIERRVADSEVRGQLRMAAKLFLVPGKRCGQ